MNKYKIENHTYYTYPQTIEEAVEILDDYDPTWYQNFDNQTFDKHVNMDDSQRCILGHVLTNYFQGIDVLFEDGIDKMEPWRMDNIFGCLADLKVWKRIIFQKLLAESLSRHVQTMKDLQHFFRDVSQD